MKIAKNYDNINWKQCNTDLERLQFKILEAYKKNCKHGEILKAQKELVQSFAARSLAVRKVTSNDGKNTAGIDGVVYLTKKEKFEAIRALRDLGDYKTQHVRRVYTPKANGKFRPLGIPTMYCRMVQTLYYFALDPIAEETSDSRSYGFRFFRGVNDNASYLKLVLGSYKATRRYILDADIENFFPSVCHKWLLNNVIMNKKVLNEFLKAGFLDENSFNRTSEGFPQRSPISPTLANLTLTGLEKHIGKEFLTTRYADDFVVLGKSKEELEQMAKPRIAEFLTIRGLRLSKEKTTVTDVASGFDCLGYNFREYLDKSRAKGTKKGILLVKPSHSKVVAFRGDLSKTVRSHRKRPIHALIQKLNEKLRGMGVSIIVQ